jgi:hypothetical protein
MSEHLAPIDPQNPGFDPGEPNAKGLTVFIFFTVIGLIVVFLGTKAFFEFAIEHQQEESIASRPSEELAAIRAREEMQLKTYGYIDKSKGVVQIPVERAMELVAKEAAEGKVKYSTAPTPVKKAEPGQDGITPVAAAAPAPAATAQH